MLARFLSAGSVRCRVRLPSSLLLVAATIALGAPSPSAQHPHFSRAMGNPPAAPLTLDEAVATALANHPALAEAAHRVAAARGDWVQAGLPPNPHIGYLAEEMGDAGRAGQQGGFVEQEFVTAGKLRLDRSIAGGQLRQAQQRFNAQRWRVENDVRIAFYRVLVAERAIQISRQLMAVANDAANAAAKLRRAELGDEIDVVQASVEAGRARVEAGQAHNQFQAAWQQLAVAMGTPRMPPVPLAGELEGSVGRLDWNEALGRLLSASPQLAEAAAGVAKARWALARAEAEPVPNVTVQSAVQYDNATGDTLAAVQAGIPLPLWNKNQGAIRSARAQLNAAQADVSRVELDLHRRLADAFQRYENAWILKELYAREILPGAQHAMELATAGWDAGEYDYEKRLIAQRTYTEVSRAYLIALEALWTSRIEIEGMLLTDGLRSLP